jgi:hypothetical protein
LLPPEDGLRTETRAGEYIDINKNYKVLYVCAYVGKLNSAQQYFDQGTQIFTAFSPIAVILAT